MSTRSVTNYWLIFAALFGFLGVAMGAFGAHGLRDSLLAENPLEGPRLLTTFKTGAQYAQIHALALFGVAILSRTITSKWLTYCGWAFVFGTAVFSVTLWALVLTGHKWLGAITPIGGLSLLVGWFLLGVTGVKHLKTESST